MHHLFVYTGGRRGRQVKSLSLKLSVPIIVFLGVCCRASLFQFLSVSFFFCYSLLCLLLSLSVTIFLYLSPSLLSTLSLSLSICCPITFSAVCWCLTRSPFHPASCHSASPPVCCTFSCLLSLSPCLFVFSLSLHYLSVSLLHSPWIFLSFTSVCCCLSDFKLVCVCVCFAGASPVCTSSISCVWISGSSLTKSAPSVEWT